MDDLFTNTTVLLTENFIKSCSKETLQSKLSKLRLVTGVQFCKANKSYALTGKWNQVDVAFEILTHWLAHPDHEPDFENAWDGKIAKLCDCEIVNDFLQKIEQNDQSESESSYVANEAENETIDETIELLEKEFNNIKSTLKVKKKVSKQKKVKSAISTVVPKPVKSVILNRHKQDIEKKKISEDTTGKTDQISNISENGNTVPKDTITNIDEDENTVDFSPPTENGTVDNDGGSKCNSEVETSKSKFNANNSEDNLEQVQSKPESNSNYDGTPKNEQQHVKSNPQKIFQNKEAKKPKKPGDKGYWSRVRRVDGDLAHDCPKCNVTLKSRKRFLEHLRRIHIKEYQCEVCEKRFGYPTDLKRHKCPGAVKANKEKTEHEIKENNNTKPASELEFRCLECNYASRFKKRLTSHVQRSHRKEHACDQCDKNFGFKKDLEKHKENIHSGTAFFCDQCSKFYKNKQIFENHLKTHENGYVKPYYSCEHCSKSFTTKYSLAAHSKAVHLGLKKVYLCQMCGKKFSQRSSYKQHCNAHNGVKPYKCNECGKAFVYHKSLKEHKFMHDTVRRFQCTLCEKAFRQRTTLHIHMKIHKTVKDHVCKVCGRGFSQKQAMERHERIHTGVRPYTCVICKKSFGDTSTIRRHMVSLHQKTESNWREDTVSTLKKRSDYYVYGGSGQNRVYKSNTERKSPISSIKESEVSQSKQLETETLLIQGQSQPLQPESSLIVLNPIQSNTQEPKFDLVVNSGTGSSVNGIAGSDTHNFQTFQNLQPGTVYAIATGQPQQLQEQNQNGEATLAAVPTNNGLGQIIDFSTMTFVATKIPQQSDKGDNVQQIIQQPLQVQGQNMNMLQSATVVPLAAVSECLKVGQSGASTQVSADSSLSQALASIWGFVGYPSYQTPGNLTQYQPQQNHSD